MNSGARSREYALGREIRSAFFLGKAGWTAQFRGGHATISQYRLYKLLANLLWDWHWLSKSYSNAYDFHGAGDLVWVPHLFGGLCMGQPTLYEAGAADFKLQDGLYASLSQLGQCKMYSLYGFKTMRAADGKFSLSFIDPGYQLERRARVEDQERHYWTKLLDVYCQLTVDELNSMATCRTPGATLLSVRAQLVRWHKNTTKALNAFATGRAAEIDVGLYFRSARECADQFHEKLRIWDHIGEPRQHVADLAAKTELAGRVPMLLDLPQYRFAGDRVEALRRHEPVIAALQSVFSQIEALWLKKGVDSEALEERLGLLSGRDLVEKRLCDASVWMALALGTRTRELARLCQDLIDACVNAVASESGVTIPRQSDFYNAVASSEYPLPRDHFKPGF